MKYGGSLFINNLKEANVIGVSEEGIKSAIEKEFGEEIIITSIDEENGLGTCKTPDGRKLYFRITKLGKYKTRSLRPDN